jgi:tRNA(adenine34) deaminase
LQDKHEYYMNQALVEAKAALEFGEVPIGAIVVRQDLIVARAHNWRETWKDPTAHAELIAIQSASRKLGGWRLSECDLYVTLEPCLMCAGSILLSRLANVYFGAYDPKGGAIASRMETLIEGQWNHHPEIRGGILADECGMILKEFFRQLRK